MADFWVRKNGGSSKALAVDLVNAMSVATFNASTFSTGDRVFFSGIDGDLTSAVIPRSGGITMLADPERGCTIHGGDAIESCIDIVSKNDIEIDGINVTHPTTDGIQIRGTSSGIVIRNVESSYSGNQAFQMEDTASAEFFDITGRNCGDDGFSMHGATVAKIYGGTFTNNVHGINTISNSNLEAYDCAVSGCTGESLYVLDSLSEGKTPIARFERCNVSGGLYGLRARENGDVSLINCVFDGMAGVNHIVDVESTAKLFTFGCVFSGQAVSKFALVFRSGSTCRGVYNSLFLPGVGRGVYALTNTDIANSIFQGLNAAVYQDSPGVVTLRNSCVYGNTQVSIGTVSTSNLITSDPALVGHRLGEFSPCISNGAVVSGVSGTYADAYGTTRARNPSIGPDQTTGNGYGPWVPFDGTIDLPVAMSSNAIGSVSRVVAISGNPSTYLIKKVVGNSVDNLNLLATDEGNYVQIDI